MSEMVRRYRGLACAPLVVAIISGCKATLAERVAQCVQILRDEFLGRGRAGG